VPNLINSKINPQVLGQDSLDKILRAELSKTGCEVELGVELHHLEQSDDHVNVSLLKHNLDGTTGVEPLREEASYDWVIGSDGAKGAVRKELGLKLLGETTPYNFIAGDFRLEGLENDVSLSVFDLSSANLIFLSDLAYVGQHDGNFVGLYPQSRLLSLIVQQH
jgi:flavin-dependent dehydrogenase